LRGCRCRADIHLAANDVEFPSPSSGRLLTVVEELVSVSPEKKTAWVSVTSFKRLDLSPPDGW
jgi:hypothetical protein